MIHDFIICPYCSEFLEDDEEYCPMCGKNLLDVELKITCPDCGFENPEENDVCYFCEHNLTETKKRAWLWKNDTTLIKLNKRYSTISLFILFSGIIFVSSLIFCFTFSNAIPKIILIFSIIFLIIFSIFRTKLGNHIDEILTEKLKNMSIE